MFSYLPTCGKKIILEKRPHTCLFTGRHVNKSNVLSADKTFFFSNTWKRNPMIVQMTRMNWCPRRSSQHVQIRRCITSAPAWSQNGKDFHRRQWVCDQMCALIKENWNGRYGWNVIFHCGQKVTERFALKLWRKADITEFLSGREATATVKQEEPLKLPTQTSDCSLPGDQLAS